MCDRYSSPQTGASGTRDPGLGVQNIKRIHERWTNVNVSNQLFSTLEEMVEEQLKRFKFHLSEENFLEGFPYIPKSQLQKNGLTETVEKMLETYGKQRALEITLHILKEINLNDLAEKLEENCRQDGMRLRKNKQEVRKRLWECPQGDDDVASKRSVVDHWSSDSSQTEQEHSYQETTAPQHLEMEKETSSNLFENPLVGRVQKLLKENLKREYGGIPEGIAEQGRHTYINKIFTEPCITEGESEGVNNEHEVWQRGNTETRTQTPKEDVIHYNDIFKLLPGQEKPIRTTMLKGVPGIGKTVLVHKFLLDWAEGKANQEVPFMFPLPFRELNKWMDEQCSLLELLQRFYPETKGLDMHHMSNAIFILDALDESKLKLNFNKRRLSDAGESTSLDRLLTNLIKGNLLPSAHVLITSRSVAANQIPPECVHRVTEVRGFNDSQKDEYFRKRFNDKDLASCVISHIKTLKSLYIMCHIPVFCWISAVVLEKIMLEAGSRKIHKTLTEMFIQFLLIQSRLKKSKYQVKEFQEIKDNSLDSEKEIILKLGHLAYEHLEKESNIFSEEDLKNCDIDVTHLEHSGFCTEILRREAYLQMKKVYCFVHLTFQEYLAALYVIHSLEVNVTNSQKSLVKGKSGALTDQVSLSDLLKNAVDKALNSKNGHLDLFLRFLFGLSRESNQKILTDFLTLTSTNQENITETAQYIKNLRRKDLSPERCINLVYCLVELGVGGSSLTMEIQRPDSSLSSKPLTPHQCSELAYKILMSEEVLDEFDLRNYNTSKNGFLRLVPVIKNCSKAWLCFCNLSPASCDAVASTLHSAGSQLTELDLSSNDLGDSGVKPICRALASPQCALLTLILSNVNLGASGVEQLRNALCGEHCRLQTLDLSNNELGDSGVKLLCLALGNQGCKLHTLRLSGCRVTKVGCASLASALRSNPSHLRELDLSYNHPGNSGVRALSAVLEDKLNVEHGGKCRNKPGLQKYACPITLDPNTANKYLSLSKGNSTIKREKRKRPYPEYPDQFGYYNQALCREGLSDTRCYWEVEWSGRQTHIGVAYKTIVRKGAGPDSCLGQNDKSWSLRFGEECRAWHRNESTVIPVPSSCSGRVGVYLDWPAGTLSFYDVSGRGRHLHTFQTSFTQPLYPGFRVVSGCVTLCSM